jgi:hypothetical protein
MMARCLILLALGSLTLILVAAGCGQTDNPSVGGGSFTTERGEGKAPHPSLGKADLIITPVEWRAEFKKDSQAAKAKYKDKVIEMSGTVSSVRPDPYGLVGYVNLDVPDDLEGVRCVLVDKKPWKKVSPGSKVKMRGKSSDRFSGDLSPCEIVEAGPNPALTVSAQELTKQFAADRKEARKKYHENWAYVQGEVTEKVSKKIALTLKGAADVSVVCYFPQPYKEQLDPIQSGSMVDLFGQLSVFDGPQDREVVLNGCTVTDVK